MKPIDLQQNPWPLEQLQRMAKHDPTRVEGILSCLMQDHPDLLVDLVIGAVDQEMLTIQQASEWTGLEHYEVERRLYDFRRAYAYSEVAIEREPRAGVARLAGMNVTVWEIVREYRKLGSVEALSQSFPDLTRKDLAVALRFAEAHPGEIQQQIEQYEAVVNRRKTEYPYAD